VQIADGLFSRMTFNNILTIIMGLTFIAMGLSIRKRNPQGKWMMFVIGGIIFLLVGLAAVFFGFNT
jgi:uncharacterized membrane protein HdeD (DUF308 family)